MNFKELKAAVLESIDVRAEFERLGVRFTKDEPNAGGWIQCRAMGREDRNPSAAVNVKTATYHDRKTNESLGIFDFAASVGAYTDWKAAFSHYAKEAKLHRRLPKKWDDLNPRDRFESLPNWTPLQVRRWLSKYPGTTIEGLQLTGADFSRYPINSPSPCYCLTWSAYGAELFESPARAFVLQSANGEEIPLYQGPDSPPKPTKRIVLGRGSGLVGKHGLHLIREGKAKLVIKTEGISDLVLLQSIVPSELRDEVAIITNANGCTETELPAEVAPVFGDLDVAILHDHDEPGQDGAKLWIGQVGKYAKSIKNVLLYDDPLPEKHGKDVSDWIGEGAAYTDLAQRISDALPFGQDSASGDESDIPAGSVLGPMEMIVKRLGIYVIGHEEDGSILLFTRDSGRRWPVKDIKRFSAENLMMMLGPDKFNECINQGDDPDPSKYHMKQVKMAIAGLSSRTRITDKKPFGPGAWEVNGRILMVNEHNGVLVNGGIESIKAPHVEDRLIDFKGPEWYDEDKLRRYYAESVNDPDWCVRQFERATKLFAQWDNWIQPDNPVLMASLVTCTFVQTVWPIRPLCSVCGSTNTGKTVLFEDTLTPIFGNLGVMCAKPSEAGIRQYLGNTAKILLVDEFEQDWHRSNVLQLLRTSSRGQEIIRGDAAQKGRRFGLKHMVWVAATELGLTDATDANRFIQMNLESRPKSAGSKLKPPPASELADLGMRLLVVALRHWKGAMSMLDALKAPDYGKEHGLRIVEIFTVPLAMIGSIHGWTVEETQQNLKQMLDRRTGETDTEQKERELLNAILDADVRVGSRTETVGRLIQSLPDHGAADALERSGILVDTIGDRKEQYVTFATSTVRKLLFRTDWYDLDIRTLLMRQDGAVSRRARVNGKQPRCVAIPISVVSEGGIESDGTF